MGGGIEIGVGFWSPKRGIKPGGVLEPEMGAEKGGPEWTPSGWELKRLVWSGWEVEIAHKIKQGSKKGGEKKPDCPA